MKKILPSNEEVPNGSYKYDHKWQFSTRNFGWRDYDGQGSDVVEEVYQNYLANRGDTDVRAVKSGEWEYMVDFLGMKQMNIQHGQHTTRDIRRIPVSEVDNVNV